MRVILASKSPRRKEILKELGVDFEIITADTDEKCDATDPKVFVKEIAERKCADVLHKCNEKNTMIISSDTVVVLDGKILGKPCNEQQAIKMLESLSGREHSVISGLCISYNGNIISSCEETTVYFANMPKKFIMDYVSSKEPMDKAGAYAIQGKASLYIEKIDGCYFNVVGFPVRLFCKMLQEVGLKVDDIVKI